MRYVIKRSKGKYVPPLTINDARSINVTVLGTSLNVISNISGINSLGQVKINFNSTISPADLSMYDDSNIFIYIEKYDEFT